MDENNKQDFDININDFVNVLNVIDIASKRGSFSGEELQQVGHVYNRFKTAVDILSERKKEIEGEDESQTKTQARESKPETKEESGKTE